MALLEDDNQPRDIEYYAATTQELADMLAQPHVEAIALRGDILLDAPLHINRDLAITSDATAAGAPFTLYAPTATPQKHHFVLQAGASLALGDIALHGNGTGGGAYVPAGSALLLQGVTAEAMQDTTDGASTYIFYANGGEITLRDCLVTGNTTSYTAVPLLCDAGAQARVESSSFTGNTGGIKADGAGTAVYALDTSFVDNSVISATNFGGAASINYDAFLYAKNCLFSNNTAGYGGAINGYSSTVTLEGCELYGNRAIAYDCDGGAIRIRSMPGHSKATLTLHDTWIGGYELGQGNETDAGTETYGVGGGVLFEGDVLTVTDSYFINNAAVGAGGGGGLYAELVQTLYIENTVFEGNTATNTNGGAAVLAGSIGNTTVKDSVFTNNRSVADENAVFEHFGAALLLFDAPADIENCVFERNSYLHSGDAAAQPFGGGALTAYYSPATIAASSFVGNYSDTDGGAIFVDDYNMLTLQDVAFAGNFAQNGGFVVTENDAHLVSAHESQLSGANSFSYPFNSISGGIYGYNNYDINYMNTLTTPMQLARLTAGFYNTGGGELLLQDYAYTGVPYTLPPPTAGFDSAEHITGTIFLGWQDEKDVYQPGEKLLPGDENLILTALSRAGHDTIELKSLVSEPEALPGTDLNYTLSITNTGDYKWEGEITAVAPQLLADLRDAKASNNALVASLTAVDTLVTATGVTLQSGDCLEITYTATVAGDAEKDDSILQTARATGAGALGPVSATAQVQTTVLAKPPTGPSSQESDPSSTASSDPDGSNSEPGTPGNGGAATSGPTASTPVTGGTGSGMPGSYRPDSAAEGSANTDSGHGGSSAPAQTANSRGGMAYSNSSGTAQGNVQSGANRTSGTGAVASTGDGTTVPWLVLVFLLLAAITALLYTHHKIFG